MVFISFSTLSKENKIYVFINIKHVEYKQTCDVINYNIKDACTLLLWRESLLTFRQWPLDRALPRLTDVITWHSNICHRQFLMYYILWVFLHLYYKVISCVLEVLFTLFFHDWFHVEHCFLATWYFRELSIEVIRELII